MLGTVAFVSGTSVSFLHSPRAAPPAPMAFHSSASEILRDSFRDGVLRDVINSGEGRSR